MSAKWAHTRILLWLCFGSAWAGHGEVLFSIGDTSWKLLKGQAEASSPDPGGWRLPEFDDARWITASGPFFYTSTPTEPPFYSGGLVSGTLLEDMLNTYTCIFLRRTFVITDVPQISSMAVQVAGDDGFIVWMNGAEVGRINMPPGQVPFNGTAETSVAEPVSLHNFVFDAGQAGLLEGTNVLAMQAFNWAIDSGDFGIMASLSVDRQLRSSCFPTPDGLAAWWPLDGTGDDTAGTNALALTGSPPGPPFIASQVGQGVNLDGASDFCSAYSSPALDIGRGEGLSVEAWINPVNASLLSDIVEWNNGAGGIGVHLSTSTASSRDLYANLVDTDGLSHQAFSGPGLLVDGVFQHVAVTYERPAGTAVLYWNGTQVARTNLGTFTPQTGFDCYVGTRRSGPFQGIWFRGVVDELSLYNRALSAEEIQGIFAAGTAGKCVAAHPLAILTQPQDISIPQGSTARFSVQVQGTPPIRYQWLFNGSPLAGGTLLGLTLTNAQPHQAGTYAVIVNDASGSVTSSPARLAVLLPLAILAPPQNSMTVRGGQVALSVTAQGVEPLFYQWLFNGAALHGSTDATLSLENVQVEQSGRYSVVISDATHSVTSPPAMLNVLAAWAPVITEFMAENHGFLTDEDGDASDWVEIFNPGPGPVTLSGWSLTDDASMLDKWRFPAVTIPVNSYLLVFASGKDRTAPGAPLHSNFRIDAEGDYLALVEPDGITIASEFAPAFPAQRADVSFGFAGGLVYFPTPTPGTANNLGVLGFVADTKVSTNRGFFFTAFDVSIRSATAGATVVYTIDGSEPTLTSGQRMLPSNSTSPPMGSLRITTTTTLRTAAFKDGYQETDVDTHSYLFPAHTINQSRPPGASTSWVDDPPGNGQSYPADFTVDAGVVNNAVQGYSFTNALLAIPSISVVTPSDGLFGPVNGIYAHAFKMGTNWERRSSIELIYPDGREGFAVEAGLRMHGAVSRLNAVISKHPLRLVFRGDYGAAELDFPLFPGSAVRRFDHLVLRACSTDAWPIADVLDFLWRSRDATYQRDQWMRDAQLAMGHPSARGIYVHLYLNGLYWGLYNLTERMSDSFCAAHLGGDRSEYDVVTDFEGEAVAGTREAWTELLQLADRAPNDPTAYWRMQGLNVDGTRNTNFPVLIHMDNFVDYIALHIYAAAIDWPGRNWWAARRRGTDSGGFYFFVWDQEIALDRLDRVGTWGNAPANIEAVYEPNTPAQIYNGLRRDPEFRLRFADRLQKNLFNDGALTIRSNVWRWAARAAEIDLAIVGESARWGDAHHIPSYTRQSDWLRTSNFTQNIYWASNLTRAWTRFKNVGLYPAVSPPVLDQFGGQVPDGFLLNMTHTNLTGSILFSVDGSDPRLAGGSTAPAATVYVQPVSLVSPTLVRARVKSGNSWSALVEAQFYSSQDFRTLHLSEIMYNPPRFGAEDGDELEFVELHNSGPRPLDLSNLSFRSGIEFTFPRETEIDPGGFFVLARNATQYAAKYPDAPLHGIYGGRLDNAGEEIRLSSPLGGTLLSVTYDDAAPWPGEADNTDLSLQRMTFDTPASQAMSWIAAVPTPGRPLPVELMDLEGDGMPQKWELDHGLLPAVLDGIDDADADGLTNYEEFRAGTDPRDPADHLRLETIQASPHATTLSVVLGFMAQSNKTYSLVYATPDSLGVWKDLAEWSARPTNRFLTVTDTLSSNAPARFYRLTTPRRP